MKTGIKNSQHSPDVKGRKTSMALQFSKSERKFLKHMMFAYYNVLNNRLNSLKLIYNDYGSPLGISPKDMLNNLEVKEYINKTKAANPEAKVVEIKSNDVLVNVELFWIYMKEIDSQNHSNDLMLYKFWKIDDIDFLLLEILFEEQKEKLSKKM